MHLKSLELSEFKSFAKKTELEFSTPITAIVGPNGSGKSNLAEAFRFVLGEQSIKSLRGSRGEDLIWGGGVTLARANRAAVKIALNNEQRLFPLDFDEVMIERAVHRDGAGEYSINSSRTRLRDVQELLGAANIGPTGHHIISQGEADRILSASAKERREMIEDALGLKVYQYKKAESERKLEKTKENIAQVEALRKEIQPHLRFLERQVKKVERAAQLREQLAAFYTAYLKREELYLAQNEQRLAEEEKTPEAEAQALASELERAKRVLADGEKDEKRDVLVALEQKISMLRQRRQDALRQSGRIEGHLGALERQAAERTRTQEREAHRPIPFAEVERVISQAQRAAQEGEKETDADGLRRVIAHIVSTLRTFLSEAVRAHQDTPEETRAQSELAKLREERERGEQVLAALADEERTFLREYEALRRAIEEESAESRTAEREVFRIMSRQRELAETQSSIAVGRAPPPPPPRDREEFTRELREGAVLIGREITRYRERSQDPDGTPLSAEQVGGEERTLQHERRRALERMKIRLEEAGAAGGEEVLKEHKEAQERDAFLAREIADLEQSIATLETLIADLAERLGAEFAAGIEKISAEFNRLFMLMFGGGTATLLLIKPNLRAGGRRKKAEADELLAENGEQEEMPKAEEEEKEDGVEIEVKLPNKRVSGLAMLSGGERALTSIALIFAMSQVNPPPFVILDETDAALDEANSRRYGDMIASLAKKSQLILITHNRETMSRAGVLYGVTMGADGVSKLLSVKFDEAVAVAK